MHALPRGVTTEVCSCVYVIIMHVIMTICDIRYITLRCINKILIKLFQKGVSSYLDRFGHIQNLT